MLGMVEHSHIRFNIISAGMKGQSNAPFHTMPGFSLSKPDGLASITVFNKLVVHRQMGGGTVMMEYAPFNSPGYPGTKHPYIGRFDHMLAIKEFIIVGFISGIKETATYIRQETKLYILVFQVNRLVLLIRFLSGKIIHEGIGVDHSFGALIGIGYIEHGIFISCHGLIGWQGKAFFPDLNLSL